MPLTSTCPFSSLVPTNLFPSYFLLFCFFPGPLLHVPCVSSSFPFLSLHSVSNTVANILNSLHLCVSGPKFRMKVKQASFNKGLVQQKQGRKVFHPLKSNHTHTQEYSSSLSQLSSLSGLGVLVATGFLQTFPLSSPRCNHLLQNLCCLSTFQAPTLGS